MLKYKLYLTSVPFDKTYKHSIRFNSRTEQEKYFNLPNVYENEPFINFRVYSLNETEIVFRSSDKDISKLMNYNYCIVYDTNETAKIKYLYYFIDNIHFDVSNQIIAKLTIDVIQTYYIDLIFQDCLIEKCHLNRFNFLRNDSILGDIYQFDNSEKSQLYYREDLKDLPKYILNKSEINIAVDSNSEQIESEIDKWIRNNIKCWVYIFFQENINKADINFSDKLCKLNNDYKFNYYIVCYPIYLSDKRIINIKYNGNKSDFTKLIVSFDGFNNLLNNINGGTAQIYDLKLSVVPPLNYKEWIKGAGINDYNINSNDDLLLYTYNKTDTSDGYIEFVNAKTDNTFCAIKLNIQDNNNRLAYAIIDTIISGDYPTIILKNLIKNTNDIYKYNPKLYDSDYREISIFDGINNYSTSPLKYIRNTSSQINKINFKYYEVINVGITRSFLSVYQDENANFYKYDNVYNGLISSRDMSIPYTVNRLNEFLSNNKNFALQKTIEYGSKISKALLYSNIFKKINETSKAIFETKVDKINTQLTLDNMEHSKELLQNGNGDCFLSFIINNCKFQIYWYKATDNDIKTGGDIMHKTGFNYNKIDNIKNVDNIRKYFNYIKADIEIVYTEYGLNAYTRDKIKEVFNNGITLWNNTDRIFLYKYNDNFYENYENYLDN